MTLHFVFTRIAPEVKVSTVHVGQFIDGEFVDYDILKHEEEGTLPAGFPEDLTPYLFTDPQVFSDGLYVENEDIPDVVLILLSGSSDTKGFVDAKISFFNNNLVIIAEYE